LLLVERFDGIVKTNADSGKAHLALQTSAKSVVKSPKIEH